MAPLTVIAALLYGAETEVLGPARDFDFATVPDQVSACSTDRWTDMARRAATLLCGISSIAYGELSLSDVRRPASAGPQLVAIGVEISPPLSVVFTDCESMTPALGCAVRPARRRTILRNRLLMLFHKPSLRHTQK